TRRRHKPADPSRAVTRVQATRRAGGARVITVRVREPLDRPRARRLLASITAVLEQVAVDRRRDLGNRAALYAAAEPEADDRDRDERATRRAGRNFQAGSVQACPMPGDRAEIIRRTPWCPTLRRASARILIGAGKLNQPTGDRSLGACIAKRGEAPLER